MRSSTTQMRQTPRTRSYPRHVNFLAQPDDHCSSFVQDHFALILNEPAGKIAQVVVENSVNLVVEAWGDHNKNDDEVVNQVRFTLSRAAHAT
jgi:hypothetical protein